MDQLYGKSSTLSYWCSLLIYLSVCLFVLFFFQILHLGHSSSSCPFPISLPFPPLQIHLPSEKSRSNKAYQAILRHGVYHHIKPGYSNPTGGKAFHKQAKKTEMAPTVRNPTGPPNYSAITYIQRTWVRPLYRLSDLCSPRESQSIDSVCYVL